MKISDLYPSKAVVNPYKIGDRITSYPPVGLPINTLGFYDFNDAFQPNKSSNAIVGLVRWTGNLWVSDIDKAYSGDSAASRGILIVAFPETELPK